MTTENVNQELAEQLLGEPYDQLNPLQKSVVDLICAEQPTGVGAHMNLDDRTFWQKLADRVAEVGGSWGFIGAFFLFLVLRIGLNAVVLAPLWHKAFDPYPFIFLNLMLSMLAAIQAPVIMMSQNRQAIKDREAAEHDYFVNLRAELEIMLLHDKLDSLRNTDLVEMIQRQNEVLDLLRAQVKNLGGEET